ncbi:MAG: hypothetical protein KatS3mg115_0595 [Candidatus Poribacteria bacterium]|nr:MAG: hypothetical protein KatS3mg115_0595 [Candidatus Poribacteria bacterium]
MAEISSILITGGAGFIGLNAVTAFREAYPNAKIIVCDNLSRRSARRNLRRLLSSDIQNVSCERGGHSGLGCNLGAYSGAPT